MAATESVTVALNLRETRNPISNGNGNVDGSRTENESEYDYR